MVHDTLQNRLLRAMTDADFAVIRPLLEVVTLNLGDVLSVPNEKVKHLYFLESGIASVVISNEQETIEVGNIGFEGLTDASVLLTDAIVSTKTFIQAPGSSYRISADDIVDLLPANQSLNSLLLLYVHTMHVQVASTALANGRYRIQECLARWLLMSQDRVRDRDLPMTHEFLSLMLGIRRAGVTEELHMLEGMHLIKAKRGHIRVLDRAGLMELAGDCYGRPERIYEELIPAPVR